MLCMSFVVAVPVSQLRASPRKGSKLLLQQMCVYGWLDCSSFIADVMVVLPELYISLIVPAEVLIVAGLGLMDAYPGIKVVVVSYQTVY